MTEKLVPTGKCHDCNKAVKGTYLYCFTCFEARKKVDSFIKSRKEKIAMLVTHRLEVTFEYPNEFVAIRCCVVVTPDLAIQAFKGEYPNIGLVFDDWFRDVVQRKVNVLTVHEIPQRRS